MADKELTEPETSPSAEQGAEHGPLVAVTFLRNPARKQKYLESEPQALGITQIGLSVFQISWIAFFLAHGLTPAASAALLIVMSLLIIIAGSLAIAAQNLHLPTLRACLGMQVVACIASVINMVTNVITLSSNHIGYACWSFSSYQNGTYHVPVGCNNLENAYTHIFAEHILIQAALVAISATLAAYCCKVVNCCSPAPKMPVITVQAPPAQQ